MLVIVSAEAASSQFTYAEAKKKIKASYCWSLVGVVFTVLVVIPSVMYEYKQIESTIN